MQYAFVYFIVILAPIWTFGIKSGSHLTFITKPWYKIQRWLHKTMWNNSLTSLRQKSLARSKASNPPLSTRKWLETDFQELVRGQRAAVISKTSRGAAMSSVNGILTVLKALNGLCSPDEVLSMGVVCSGEHIVIYIQILSH